MAPGCRARASWSVSTIRLMQTGRPPAPLELEVEEAEVEAGIVRDQRRILEEFEQFLGLLDEQRLVRQENAW